MSLPDLHSSSAVIGEELTAPDYRESAEFRKRIAKFTGSQDHRLMAGIDTTDEDRKKAYIKTWGVKEDLIKKARGLGLKASTNNKVDELVKMLWEKTSDAERKTALADTLPKGALSYVEEKVIEQRNDILIDTPDLYWMERGKELEPETVAVFEEITGLTVTKWGDDQVFEDATDIPELKGEIGATKDGEVLFRGRAEGFEGKAPKDTTHQQYLYGSPDWDEKTGTGIPPLTKHTMRAVKPNYYWQIIKGFLVTDHPAWWFVSYHPAFQGDDRMLIIRITREEVQADIAHSIRRNKMAVAEKHRRLAVVLQAANQRAAELRELLTNN